MSLPVPRLYRLRPSSEALVSSTMATAACVATSSRPVRAALVTERVPPGVSAALVPRVTHQAARAHINAPIPQQARMVTPITRRSGATSRDVGTR